jgi:hypothetical protein
MQIFVLLELQTYEATPLIMPRQAFISAEVAQHFKSAYENSATLGEQYWIVELTLEDKEI